MIRKCRFRFTLIISVLVLPYFQSSHGSDAIRWPRYFLSYIQYMLGPLEAIRLSSTATAKSPLIEEPLFSYEFFYIPFTWAVSQKEKRRATQGETTTIKEQLNNIDQAFIKLKNLLGIPNEEWQEIKARRTDSKLKNRFVAALKRPRFLYSHNPFINPKMIPIAERVFELLGLNLYSCDFSMAYYTIKPVGARVRFSEIPFLKPTIVIDQRYMEKFTDSIEKRNWMISLLSHDLVEIMAGKDVDDSYRAKFWEQYLKDSDDQAKKDEFFQIEKRISSSYDKLHAGIESYIETFYDKS